MSGPNPPHYVFDDRGIAIFSSVILAVALIWQCTLVLMDLRSGGNRRFRAIRADAISAFLSISIGISTIAGWPQSQNISSMMVFIMAQASSIGWLENIHRKAVPGAVLPGTAQPGAANRDMSGEDKVAKLFEIF